MEGTMEEESAQRVTLVLQERGAQVNSVEEVRKAGPFELPSFKRLHWDDLALLNEQLLSIARSGLPIAPAVKAMAKDLDNRRLKPVLEQLHQDLDAGHSLEEALERSPRSFPPIYVSLIRAGERSGDLAGVLEMLSSYSTRILDLRDRVFMALTYPTFVIAAGVLVLFNVLYNVVPEFEEVFNDFGSGLPAPTQFLVNISHLIREHAVAMAAAATATFALIAWAVMYLKRHEAGRARLDRLLQSIPLVGRTFRTISIARFSKALGLLLRAQVPILESLDLASAGSGNGFLRRHVREASSHISQGEKIADALSDTGYFPHSYLWFLANGEARGDMSVTLLELSEAYEREVSTRDQAMMHLIAPVAVIAVGVVIFFVVIALYLPIFTLGDAISG